MHNGVEVWTWDRLAECDVLFAQRPHTAAHLRIIMAAQQLGMGIWVDLDDDMLSVPEGHPNYQFFSKDETKDTIKECISLAHAVTVTTKTLKTACGREDAIVMPNALNDYVIGFNRSPREKIIMWRGSCTHADDVSNVVTQIESIAHRDEFKDWMWWLVGDPPWALKRAIPENNVHIGPGWDKLDGVAWQFLLQSSHAYIQIHPLVDNAFNRSKSNLAWIEATAAGALSIMPNMPEFDRGGVLNYGTPEQFETVMLRTMRGFNHQGHPEVGYARDNVTRHYLLSKINVERWRLIKNLVRKPKSKVCN